MRIPCWSFWLIGICLTDAVHAAPLATEDAGAVRERQAQQWQTAEVPGGVRLALAKDSPRSRVGLCLGFELQSLARDGKPSVSELLDLQTRSESLANQCHERDPGGNSTWTQFSLAEGATLLECLSVPLDDSASALAAVLDTLRPLSLTTNDCNQMLEQWQRHEGLARSVDSQSLAHRARNLAWLGSRPQQLSIATALQQIDSEACARWRPLGVSNPSIVTLAVIGVPDIASTEKAIRSHQALRQRQRTVHLQYPRAAPPLKLPERTFPRFLRVRDPQSTQSSLMLAWPVVRQSDRHEFGLRQIASLIEQRLRSAWGPHAERSATVRLHWGSLEGMLVIEVHPTAPDTLASTEERVFAVLEQLRSTPVNSTELDSELADPACSPPLTGDLDLDQALYVAQKSLFSWNPHVMVQTPKTYPTPTDLQQWIREDLSRLHVIELFNEAPAPRQKAIAPNQGQPPRGPAYTVKAGESLQMIAHKFHVTIPDLIRVNHLRHPDQIAPGTRLTIPSSPRSTPSN